MKIRTKLFFISLLFVIFNANAQKMNTNKKDYIDLKKVSLKEYFEMLKIDSTKFDSKNNYISVISVKAPENWIAKKDVKYLMKYIESEKPSYCIMQFLSSNLPIGNTSTLGGQAMNLIDSYRLGKTYPYVLTDCSKTDQTRIEEIKKWWNTIK